MGPCAPRVAPDERLSRRCQHGRWPSNPSPHAFFWRGGEGGMMEDVLPDFPDVQVASRQVAVLADQMARWFTTSCSDEQGLVLEAGAIGGRGRARPSAAATASVLDWAGGRRPVCEGCDGEDRGMGHALASGGRSARARRPGSGRSGTPVVASVGVGSPVERQGLGHGHGNPRSSALRRVDSASASASTKPPVHRSPTPLGPPQWPGHAPLEDPSPPPAPTPGTSPSPSQQDERPGR